MTVLILLIKPVGEEKKKKVYHTLQQLSETIEQSCGSAAVCVLNTDLCLSVFVPVTVLSFVTRFTEYLQG